MNFNEIYNIDVSDKIEKKDGLDYLSWAVAWAEFKKIYPDAKYDIIKDENGKCYFGEESIGYMVYTYVIADGVRHDMWLPVTDGANKSMKLTPYKYEVKNKNFKYATLNKQDGKYYDKYGNEQTETIVKKVDAMTIFDVNTTLMRCLTKNLAMFGLGLSLYINEDLREIIGKDKQDGADENGENKPTQPPKKEVVKPIEQPKKEAEQPKFKPITRDEILREWGIQNVEETIVWFEGRFGVEFANWGEEECEIARAKIAEKKKKKEAEKAKMAQGLSGIRDEDLPFPKGE